ncbi:MAG: nitroreductase family deazaflavin-dependent oxidoreductase [Anaerolineales bacterium]
MKPLDSKKLAREEYWYLVTTGRVSGEPHEIEIWFGMEGQTIYLLSGGKHRSDWVRNLKADRRVRVRIGKHTFAGLARFVNSQPEGASARRLLATKYYRWREGQPLNSWARTALPVAIELLLE